MRRLLTIALCACATAVQAQNIDFDFPGRQTSEVTESNYVSWPVPRVESDQKMLDNGVVLTVSGGEQASAVGSTWSKTQVQAGLKLIGDGVMACNIEDGNMVKLTAGRTALVLTIEGMTPGQHSVIAYHNNPGAKVVLPPIEVEVDGVVRAQGTYSSGAEKYSEAGTSFVEFNVTEGKPVVIRYISVPQDGVSYNTTSVTLNGLEFDVAAMAAMDPQPASYDYHAGTEDGTVSFSWTPAEGATAHKLVLGTDSTEVANATAYVYEGAEPAYTKTGLSALQRYWWRVDEVDAQGTVHKGKTWAFQPCRLAFPGAEGYGRYALGGRGGTVYHVTSLADDNTPGTLRYGITQLSGPRTIVFDVAGVIYLQSRLTCSAKYVTIAGQTAPGNGILLRGCPFGMASDGITRFLRLHRGHILSENDANKGLDGMGMAGNDHAIMDHCSIAWTIDEGFSSRGAKNITLQRTLISEALNVAGHPNYGDGKAHGFAATIGGGQAGGTAGSFHHNLLAHNEGRNWSISGGLDGSGYYDGGHDVFNNVVYNWHGRATDGGSHEMNFVANYYKQGPSGFGTKMLLNAQLEGTGKGSQSYYVSGNIRENKDGSLTRDKLNETYKYSLSSNQTLDWEVFRKEPFFPSFAVIETAEAAYKNVLSDVGCTLPELNLHDQRMIRETLNRTTSTKGSRSGLAGLIDSEEDAGCEGFDMAKLGIVEAQRDANWDTDQDGIPNWFETLVGTNPNTANNNDDTDNNTYTDLEDYLNWMAQPNFRMDAGQEQQVDLAPYFAAYKSLAAAELTVLPENVVATISNGTLSVKTTNNSSRLIDLRVRVTEDGIALTRHFHFAVSGTGTGISSLTPTLSQGEGAWYNLAGQRLSQPQHGLNIQKGHKVIIK